MNECAPVLTSPVPDSAFSSTLTGAKKPALSRQEGPFPQELPRTGQPPFFFPGSEGTKPEASAVLCHRNHPGPGEQGQVFSPYFALAEETRRLTGLPWSPS